MATEAEKLNKEQIKKDRDEIQPGDTVKIYQKIPAVKGKDKNKEKIQIFEGLVLARKHGKGINATITVRKVIAGIGVEKIFPIHSPNIDKIEIVKRGKTRRAKLYYLRTAKGRKARLKRKDLAPAPAPASPGAERSAKPDQPAADSAKADAEQTSTSKPEQSEPELPKNEREPEPK